MPLLNWVNSYGKVFPRDGLVGYDELASYLRELG